MLYFQYLRSVRAKTKSVRISIGLRFRLVDSVSWRALLAPLVRIIYISRPEHSTPLLHPPFCRQITCLSPWLSMSNVLKKKSFWDLGSPVSNSSFKYIYSNYQLDDASKIFSFESVSRINYIVIRESSKFYHLCVSLGATFCMLIVKIINKGSRRAV